MDKLLIDLGGSDIGERAKHLLKIEKVLATEQPQIVDVIFLGEFVVKCLANTNLSLTQNAMKAANALIQYTATKEVDDGWDAVARNLIAAFAEQLGHVNNDSRDLAQMGIQNLATLWSFEEVFLVSRQHFTNKSIKVRELYALALCEVLGNTDLEFEEGGPLSKLTMTLIPLLSDEKAAVRDNAQRALVLSSQLDKTIRSKIESSKLLKAQLNTVLAALDDADATTKSGTTLFQVTVKPIFLSEEKEAKDEVNSLFAKLTEEKYQWNDKAEAIQRFSSVILGGTLDYRVTLQAGLKKLREGINNQLKDLRAALVKDTCMLLNICAFELRDAFVVFADYFAPQLIKLLHTAKVIADAAEQTLTVFLCYCSLNTMPALMDQGIKSKHTETRLIVADLMYKTLDESSLESLEKHAELYESTLKKMVNDAQGSVRKSARRVVFAFQKAWPTRGEKLLSSFESSVKQLADKEALAVQSQLKRGSGKEWSALIQHVPNKMSVSSDVLPEPSKISGPQRLAQSTSSIPKPGPQRTLSDLEKPKNNKGNIGGAQRVVVPTPTQTNKKDVKTLKNPGRMQSAPVVTKVAPVVSAPPKDTSKPKTNAKVTVPVVPANLCVPTLSSQLPEVVLDEFDGSVFLRLIASNDVDWFARVSVVKQLDVALTKDTFEAVVLSDPSRVEKLVQFFSSRIMDTNIKVSQAACEALVNLLEAHPQATDSYLQDPIANLLQLTNTTTKRDDQKSFAQTALATIERNLAGKTLFDICLRLLESLDSRIKLGSIREMRNLMLLGQEAHVGSYSVATVLKKLVKHTKGAVNLEVQKAVLHLCTTIHQKFPEAFVEAFNTLEFEQKAVRYDMVKKLKIAELTLETQKKKPTKKATVVSRRKEEVVEVPDLLQTAEIEFELPKLEAMSLDDSQLDLQPKPKLRTSLSFTALTPKKATPKSTPRKPLAPLTGLPSTPSRLNEPLVAEKKCVSTPNMKCVPLDISLDVSEEKPVEYEGVDVPALQNWMSELLGQVNKKSDYKTIPAMLTSKSETELKCALSLGLMEALKESAINLDFNVRFNAVSCTVSLIVRLGQDAIQPSLESWGMDHRKIIGQLTEKAQLKSAQQFKV